MNTAKIILGALLLVFSLSFAVDVSTCGVISAPGTYNVLNDLTTATGDCIVIDADNVNLNGNGYSISAISGAYPLYYAIYVTEGSDNVVVDRALLKDSLAGIRAGGDGPDAGSDVTPVDHLTLRNIVANNNGYGFELIGVTNSLIEHNTAWESTRIGFELSTSDGNTIQYNNVWLTGGDINSPQDGFYLKDSSSNSLIGNTANQNAKQGFEIVGESNNNILDSNIAWQNDVGFWLGGSGDNVPDGNRLYGNTANDNGIGIEFIFTGTQNAIIGSTVSNNGNGGIIATQSPALEVSSNLLTNNGAYPTSSGIQLYLCTGYIASDNQVDGSPNGIKILNSNMGTLDNTIISDSPYPLLVQDSTGNQITAITVKDSGPVLLRGDATDNSITLLTMRDPTGEVTVDIPVYSGEYEVSITTAPGAAPEGLTALNRYVSVVNTVPGNILLAIHYEDSDYGTLNESTVAAMLWGGSWSAPAQTLSMGSNGVLMDNPGFSIFGLFAGVPPEEPPVEPPVVPPVTPPSGGGSTGGGSGGRSGGGGAVHIGVPYVPSGGEGFGGEATTPSCTSDSECASSAACNGGICTALEAGGDCGTFQNHSWVDFECCDTSDCGAGEVCKDNVCTSMEPLVITPGESTTVASDEGLGRLLADVPWWVLALLLLMVGGGIYARYAMGREPPEEGEEGSEEEMPPAGEEEE